MTPVRYPDSLRILAALRQFTEADFARLLHARRVSARGIGDLLDLAEALDEPASVAEAIRRLDWPTLRDLRNDDPAALGRAAELLLAVRDADGASLLPAAESAIAAALPHRIVFESDLEAGAGASAAHRSSVLVADALWLLDAAPRQVRQGREGVRMSGVELRRLAQELDSTPALTGSLYRWLFDSGLMAPDDDVWRPTAAGRAAIDLSAPERWLLVLRAWLGELRLDDVTRIAASLGVAVTASSQAADPAPSLATSAIDLDLNDDLRIDEAEALGVLERGALTPAGAAALNGDLDGARSLLSPAFPTEVTQVYLQPDQTVIAPGPLSGALDRRLREVAQLERRAVASEYRVTAASLHHALAHGRSETEIREFLREVSLTGVPQPVDYLIANSASRFGLIRVADAPRGARAATRIRTDEATLRDTMRIDANLRSLGLRDVERELETSVSAETVLVTLHEARYPAVREDADGAVVPSAPSRSALEYRPPIGQTVAKTAAELAEQAAAPVTSDDRETWLRRRLELARRAKSPVQVTVDTPNGRHQLQLVPTAVSPQRLRARDVDADVERTLPLSAILSVDDTSSAAPDDDAASRRA